MRMDRRITALVIVLALSTCILPPPAMAQWRDRSDELPGFANISKGTLILVGALLVGGLIYMSSHKKSRGSGNAQRDLEIDVLATQLADSSIQNADSVGDQLAAIGKPAVRKVIGVSQNTDPVIRCRAARVLGKIQDPGASKHLRKMLRDADPTVKVAALNAVGASGDKSALKDVTALASDKDEQVRAAAEAATAQLQNTPANP